MLLELKDITKSFSGVDGDVEVLRGVSLGLDAGQTLALTGESGSGKSTILHISAGLEVPDGGSLHLEGVEINELSEACLLYTSPSPRDLSTSRMPSSA